MTLEHLHIIGHNNESVPNRFIKQAGGSKHLAMFFPGFAYGTDLPALYYPARLFSDLGVDVLLLDKLYSEIPNFRDLPEPERARMIVTDGLAMCEAGLAQQEYQQITLVGKSLGTLTMARLLKLDPRLAQATCVWLTPLLKHDRLRNLIVEKRPHSLFVIGSADDHYDRELLSDLQETIGGESIVLEEAGHSLEIPGKLIGSMQQMVVMVEKIEAFIKKAQTH